jgi:hypothetical protein
LLNLFLWADMPLDLETPEKRPVHTRSLSTHPSHATYPAGRGIAVPDGPDPRKSLHLSTYPLYAFGASCTHRLPVSIEFVESRSTLDEGAGPVYLQTSPASWSGIYDVVKPQRPAGEARGKLARPLGRRGAGRPWCATDRDPVATDDLPLGSLTQPSHERDAWD